MSKLLQRGADIISITIGVVVGGSILALVGRGAAYLPAFDAWVAPVIQVDDITDIYRDEIKACFTLHLTKLREATPLKYEWHAETPLSPRIGVSVWLATDDNKRRGIQRIETHRPGQSWLRRYCFEIPGTISDRDTMTMTGAAFHRRHPFWPTETSLPVFSIAAVPVER